MAQKLFVLHSNEVEGKLQVFAWFPGVRDSSCSANPVDNLISRIMTALIPKNSLFPSHLIIFNAIVLETVCLTWILAKLKLSILAVSRNEIFADQLTQELFQSKSVDRTSHKLHTHRISQTRSIVFKPQGSKLDFTKRQSKQKNEFLINVLWCRNIKPSVPVQPGGKKPLFVGAEKLIYSKISRSKGSVWKSKLLVFVLGCYFK